MPGISYPRRRAHRLSSYDYAQTGAYFVTLCVEDRRLLFGQIEDGQMHPSLVGQAIAHVWSNLPDHYAGVDLDAFVVMPNHLHGLVLLQNADGLSLSEVIRRFKAYTTRRWGMVVDGQKVLWQRNFHDRVVRNERELDAIREYIANNPAQWELDRENPSIVH